jgi:hypothetical protein
MRFGIQFLVQFISIKYLISFSKILEKEINKYIGINLDVLGLSPLLKIGITVEYFNLDGKKPTSRDLLKMYVRGELI